ncbi:MAG: response regulator [Bacteroidia bacterium]|nr:response regulator [Bacteroidia bacterium]
MSKTNILIVEDESIVAKDIHHSLKKLGYNVIDIVSTGESAIISATEKKPDLVLMDIMLKGEMNGIEAAQVIKEKLSIPVIFLTAYADESTFNKAKITEPYAYIIKPFKEVDLHTSIEMAIYKHEKISEVQKERDFLYSLVENKDTSKDSIFIRANSRLTKVKNSDIVYIEALKDYVVVNTLTTKYTIHSTMKDILAKLPPNEFIRIHRSYIVRIERIAAIEYPNLILDIDKKVLSIGGSYRDEFLNKINLL